MKKTLILFAVFGLIAAHIENPDEHAHTDLDHEDTDVSRTRIELPYDSSVFVKKRLTHGHIYTTEMSDPNLLFKSEAVVENFQYFEISCNICEPHQELALILRESVDALGFGWPEPEIRAYNVYIV